MLIQASIRYLGCPLNLMRAAGDSQRYSLA